MKIINRKQFMELPPGSVCCEGEPWAFGGWFIKRDNCGDSDYFLTELDWTQFKWMSSSDMDEAAEDALKSGSSLHLHFDDLGRDGCYNNNAIYCVLEDDDIDVLIKRLQEAKEATKKVSHER